LWLKPLCLRAVASTRLAGGRSPKLSMLRSLVLLMSLKVGAAMGPESCSAALGLRPHLMSPQEVQEKTTTRMQVKAINECVSSSSEQTVSSKLVADALICIKPVAKATGDGWYAPYAPQSGGLFHKVTPVGNKCDSTWQHVTGCHDRADVTGCDRNKCDAADGTYVWGNTHFEWKEGAPDWCHFCHSDHPDNWVDGVRVPNCYTLKLVKDVQFGKNSPPNNVYPLFELDIYWNDSITEQMAKDAQESGLVFEAETTDVAVHINDDQICNQQNMGGAQGSIPWTWAQATSTTTTTLTTDSSTTRTLTTDTSTTRTLTTDTSTTRTSNTDTSTTSTLTTTPCLWPCCRELRQFMDDVVDFMASKGSPVHLESDVCTVPCVAAETGCPSTPQTTTPAPPQTTSPPSPGPPCHDCGCPRCGQDADSDRTLYIWFMTILCSVLLSVGVTTLWLQRFPAAERERMRGAPASEPLLMH